MTHHWFIRHLYYPLLRLGVRRELANLSVFIVSALLHELFISGGLGVVSYIAFLGLIIQIPLVLYQIKFNKVFGGGLRGWGHRRPGGGQTHLIHLKLSGMVLCVVLFACSLRLCLSLILKVAQGAAGEGCVQLGHWLPSESA